ncbi:Ovule protein [Caenorhabditis elegans]|uniref:Ovule protein n=1 Tax=Caenorhabditis elegans TaxID=6239 RepID=Q19455_CAEEL|nr:Ovule protein [Caenorhabditis elegans]CAB01159.2 Ovule protein [Caenorhabditis elegans]|eukprot:NP_001343569.1 Uncharacterized protein CELE_F14D7.3 [Caenorhabditis elegans]
MPGKDHHDLNNVEQNAVEKCNSEVHYETSYCYMTLLPGKIRSRMYSIWAQLLRSYCLHAIFMQ